MHPRCNVTFVFYRCAPIHLAIKGYGGLLALWLFAGKGGSTAACSAAGWLLAGRLDCSDRWAAPLAGVMRLVYLLWVAPHTIIRFFERIQKCQCPISVTAALLLFNFFVIGQLTPSFLGIRTLNILWQRAQVISRRSPQLRALNSQTEGNNYRCQTF